MKKVITIAISTLLIATSFTPANAAEKGWRYWGYFQAAPGTSDWSYATTGPAGSTPSIAVAPVFEGSNQLLRRVEFVLFPVHETENLPYSSDKSEPPHADAPPCS